MSMQDKDLDALFSGKLKHLEVEPSARVWKGITLELDGVKYKSRLMPVIRIAASVVLILSAGIFFLMRGEKKVSIANDNRQRSKSIKELTDEDGNQTIALVTPQISVTQQHAAISAIKKQPVQPLKKHALKTQTSNLGEQPQTNPEIIVDNQPVLAATSTEQTIVPDVPLVAHHDVYANDKFITAANTNVPDLPVVKQKVKKRSIRTLGDIINVVVAKVDKRDDKIIEFSNTDDDGSIVSGINLGLIRIKKD